MSILVPGVYSFSDMLLLCNCDSFWLDWRCRLEEQLSKNNSYSMSRYNEEEFQSVFHSYDENILMTLKQYKHHLPLVEEKEIEA